ncbi:unnamed protein product [Thlaspi arvense]|uniref:Phototropic-responsive NPH3 family protein n=1 Tax=Thlaspi arvense TaxID=13288 RepID=A0AAU9S2N2_THLAR|nr:unnamed protein product [Thlaspi arvense]
MSDRYSKNPSTRNSESPDLDLYVKGTPFYLHKETLAKKSAKVTSLIECNKIDELRWILRDMDIDPETFFLVARFCYGLKIQLSSENIVSVLCVSYYLEMNDDHSSNNLLNKAFTFLEQRVLMSWNETVKALRVCSDKILDKMTDVGLIEVFLDSLVEKALNDPGLLEDLITLPLRLYESLIIESSKHNVSKENLVASICNYAKRWVFENVSGDESVSRHKREVIEAIERLLPHQRGAISCGFLFESLKESIFLDACSDCQKGFEVRISKQLDMATAKDLLVLLSKEDGSYDIDLLRTILKSFYSNYNVSDVSRLVSVARMLEEFLFEAAASDAGLRVETFKALGEMVVAASCDVLRYSDEVYRAVDVLLERHRDLTESEKMEACRVLECKKLSPKACEHASKNEKLPLRIVLQVLFFSQNQIRDKVAREMKGAEEKTEEVDEEEEKDDEIDDMNKKLLRLDIESDYSKRGERENLECVVHCTNKKVEEKKISVWREVKRKFGCMTSFTVDACNCHIKKRKKTYHRYK